MKNESVNCSNVLMKTNTSTVMKTHIHGIAMKVIRFTDRRADKSHIA